MPYLPRGYFPTGSSEAAPADPDPCPPVIPSPLPFPFVPEAEAPFANGLFALVPRGKKPVVYIARGNENKVQALVMDGSAVALSGGVYETRPVLGREEREKRGVRFVQEGTCAPGTVCTATLTLLLDNTREVVHSLRGPFDRNRNILWYTELRGEVVTGREIAASLTEITGLDVELTKQHIEYVER